MVVFRDCFAGRIRRTLRFAVLLALGWHGSAPESAYAEPTNGLARRAFLGAKFDNAGSLRLVGFAPGGSAQDSELRVGDKVVRVGDRPVRSVAELQAALKPQRAGDKVELVVVRNGAEERVAIDLKPYPQERADDLEVLYDHVDSGEKSLRCLVSRPQPAPAGPLPAVLYIQGIDDSSIEAPFSDPNHMREFVYALSRAGFAVMRCEKSGVGDSSGVPAKQLGLAEEAQDFTAALRKLKSYDFVSANDVFLFGHSAGGWVAPLVAGNEPVAGLMVYGTVVRPFGEYLVETHRRSRWRHAGIDPVKVELEVRQIGRLWNLLLNDGLSRAEALERDPTLRDIARVVFPTASDSPFEIRSLDYFREVHAENLPAAWAKLKSPVLALCGEYELRTTAFDHEYIAEIVNYHAPGQGSWKLLPQLDHGFAVHESLRDAIDNELTGPFGDAVVTTSVDWLKQVVAAKKS